ncbi:MAG: hypothetical protein M3082_18355 [Candidatus Dormibacteraeota bacterium]|nr:hypothetical protein [Candidatus Dormibacteraeota bacterium]
MEFNNSEELKRHQEEAHPKDEGQTDTDRENPEIQRETPDSDPVEMPPPAERTR